MLTITGLERRVRWTARAHGHSNRQRWGWWCRAVVWCWTTSLRCEQHTLTAPCTLKLGVEGVCARGEVRVHAVAQDRAIRGVPGGVFGGVAALPAGYPRRHGGCA